MNPQKFLGKKINRIRQAETGTEPCMRQVDIHISICRKTGKREKRDTLKELELKSDLNSLFPCKARTTAKLRLAASKHKEINEIEKSQKAKKTSQIAAHPGPINGAS
jgi:hypothetical protein